MKKTFEIEEIQDKIYRKMSARKKLALVDLFYRTGTFLNNLNQNERKNSNRTFNLDRQSSRQS